MSDYVDFDVDDDNSNPTTISASNTSMAEPFENVNVDAHYGGMVDTNFAGMSHLPQVVNPMDLQLDIAPVAFAGFGGSNAFQAPVVTPATPHANFDDAMDLGSGDVVDMVDPFGVPVDFSATYCHSLTMSPDSLGRKATDNFQNPMEADGTFDDFTGGNPMAFPGGVDLVPIMRDMEQVLAMNPHPQEWKMTDHFQNPMEAGGTLDDFPAVDPMAFAGGADLVPTVQDLAQLPAFADGVNLVPTPHEIAQVPSMWAPVSPGLQQQLNSEFAPQLGLLAADPSPPPVLFLPAEGGSVHPVSNIPFLPPNADLPWNGFPYSPQQSAENLLVDPKLIMQENGEVSFRHLPSAGTYALVPSDADALELDNEDQALLSSIMPASGTHGFQLEPAPKRSKIAEPLPANLEDIESSDDDDGFVSQVETAGQGSLPTDVKDEDYDNTLDADGETDSDYVSDSADSSDPLSAHATSSLPSHERHEEGARPQVNGTSVGVKIYNCKTRKMLKEIEDSRGFAGAQSVEVGVNGRPVRKGARKNYEGQE